MGKKINISIPQSCHEDWNGMNPVEKGRFCNSCQKQVVDFTGMSDAQLVAFFRKPTTGSLCGRFMEDQLHRDLPVERRNLPWIRYFFQVAIPALLISAKATAQGAVKFEISTATHSADSISNSKGQVKATAPKTKTLITGKVVDDKGEPIPFTSVIIRGTNIGAASDVNGLFMIDCSVDDPSAIILDVSSVGFQSKEIKLNRKKSENMVIQLPSKEMMGEVVVVANGAVMGGLRTKLVTTRKSFVDTVMNSLYPTPASLKIYPNPVAANTSVNISLDNPAEGGYNLRLITVGGQLIFDREIWIDKGARVLDIPIPGLAPGSYLLSMTNKKSKHSQAGKMVVQ